MEAGPAASIQLRYRALIGVGGIGSGVFFAVRGNETLGREESRLGRFLDRRDYCKLHIIAHYVRTLLGPSFLALPIGCVGDDPAGRRLLQEMAEAGLDTRLVKVSLEHPTLYSFCFTYPDGSGGNLTTDDSACSMIEPAAVAEAFFEFREFRGRGVALAAPEVPLSVRSALLETGRRHDFFTVAAFASEEVLMALEQGMLENVGLLAMNRHEAAALARLPAEASSVRTIVESAMAVLVPRYPGLLVSITAGVQGSWIWEGNRLTHRTALEVNVAGASGAGDAHLAGLIVGLAAGLTLAQAHELAILLACFSVTSPHTIHPGATRRALREFAQQAVAPLSPPLEEFLKDHEDH